MEYILTPSHVHGTLARILTDTLKLQDYQRVCPVSTLLLVVWTACARLISLTAAARSLLKAPCPETVRKGLKAQLTTAAELHRRINRALQFGLPPARPRRRRCYDAAIDLTLVPYYGKPLSEEYEVYRGQPKSGTTHFHAYATLCLVEQGQRFTVALRWVKQKEPLAEVVRGLMRTASHLSVRPRKLLLDRGFYTVDVIRYLQHARYPFLMPVPIKGRKVDHPQGPGGTRVFTTWRRSGYGDYRLHSTGRPPASVRIAVHVRNRAGRRGKRGREHLVYAFWGFSPPSRVASLSEQYRRRFGIESSYRQSNQSRPRTCSRDPLVRLFLIGVTLVMRNVWVWLNAEFLSRRRRSGRQSEKDVLTLKAMLHWLQCVAESTLGVALEKQTQQSTESILR